jgi:glutamyl/glutaminyl-tRNA synthetase
MIDAGHAYISQEEATEDDPKKRAEVIRFKNPNKIITFTDIIRGEVSIDTTDLEDFVIAKDLDTPLYHLAVVIDDFESGITHIIRGDDGISNTPRQILIQEAIGAPRPVYAHIPLIVAPDRSKLSKRHGAHAVRDFRERGYLKEALVNFIALLGWHPEKSDKELYTLSEFIDEFSLESVVKSAAVFDNEKLSQRTLEDTFNSSGFKALFGLGEEEKVRRSSISERLSKIDSNYFKEIYEQMYSLSVRSWPAARRMRPVSRDSGTRICGRWRMHFSIQASACWPYSLGQMPIRSGTAPRLISSFSVYSRRVLLLPGLTYVPSMV